MKKCCHESAVIHCPHPCLACRMDAAKQLREEILKFARDCDRDEHMDTGRAGELLASSGRLLAKIIKEAA